MTSWGGTSWRAKAGASAAIAALSLVGLGELRGQGVSPLEIARDSQPEVSEKQRSDKEAHDGVVIQAARSVTDAHGALWEGSALMRHGRLVMRSESVRRVHVAPGFPWKNLAPGSKGADNHVEALRARGQVKVSFSTIFMMADEALYEPSRSRLTMRGQVRIWRGQEQLKGREAVLELNDEGLTVLAARGRLEVPRDSPGPAVKDEKPSVAPVGDEE